MFLHCSYLSITISFIIYIAAVFLVYRGHDFFQMPVVLFNSLIADLQRIYRNNRARMMRCRLRIQAIQDKALAKYYYDPTRDLMPLRARQHLLMNERDDINDAIMMSRLMRLHIHGA